MSKKQIRFIKGSITDYDEAKMQGVIYFAEDKKKIIVDGIEYGLDLESDEIDLISNIEHEDNKLTIVFSNGKTKELELEDHRTYWEELPSLEELYPMGGCIINTHPIKEFSFKGGNNNNGKWYSSDGQEGKYGDESTTTITFKEEGEYVIKLVSANINNINSLEEVTDNSVKSVFMIGGSNGKTMGIKSVNKNENAKLIFHNNITSIGNGAFWYCRGFTGELIIPEGVISIEGWAFGNCTGFTGDLIIPEGVISIGDGAFISCIGFNGELKLPESLTSIGESAFESCYGFIGDLIIPEGVTSIRNSAFNSCYGFTGDLIIPEGVISIGERAFNSCRGFTGELVLPESLTSIGYRAFNSCRGFTGELIIPEGVISIGERAFESCSGFIGDLIIPDSVTSIGNRAFYDCSGLSKIYVCEDTELGDLWNSGTPAEVIKYKKGEKPWL